MPRNSREPVFEPLDSMIEAMLPTGPDPGLRPLYLLRLATKWADGLLPNQSPETCCTILLFSMIYERRGETQAKRIFNEVIKSVNKALPSRKPKGPHDRVADETLLTLWEIWQKQLKSSNKTKFE